MFVKFYDISDSEPVYSVVCFECKQTMVFTSSKRKKREKNVVSATKARWVIKKQSAQISEEHNYANAGTCNATSSLSLNLPDLNNIVADEEVDDVNADTDDSDDCESKHSSMPWDSGRRVVELGVLANALASCKNCTNPLQLSHATSIRTYGLAAILKVPCSNTNCRFVNNVPTGKQHGKTHIWDVNTKLANGSFDTCWCGSIPNE